MAAERSRRANAGSRMHLLMSGSLSMEALFEADDQVLDDEDDFQELISESEDDVDSDFDSDEDEDNDIDAEEDEDQDEDNEAWLDDAERAKRRQKQKHEQLIEKLKRKPAKTPEETLEASSSPPKRKPAPKRPAAERQDVAQSIAADVVDASGRVRSMRRSTVMFTKKIETKQRIEDERRQSRLSKVGEKLPRVKDTMTQEERLEEAKVTEEYNRLYLEYYQQYELEKTRIRTEKKAAPKGPTIHFHSYAEELSVRNIPKSPVKNEDDQTIDILNDNSPIDLVSPVVIEETTNDADADGTTSPIMETEKTDDSIHEDSGMQVDQELSSSAEFDSSAVSLPVEPTLFDSAPMEQDSVSQEADVSQQPDTLQKQDASQSGYQARNLVTFLHWPSQPLHEWSKVEPYPSTSIRKAICPITGLHARYRDPLTGVPYANSEAFKTIRSMVKNDMIWDSRLHVFR